MEIKNDLYYEFEGTEEYYKLKPSLTISEKSAFVNFVVDSIAGDHYLPLLKDVLFGYALVKYLTNINMGFLVTWSDEAHDYILNLDMVELFLRETGITRVLIEAYPVLVDELRENVDDAVAYKTGIRKSGLAFEFGRLVRDLDHFVSGLEPANLPWDKILSLLNREENEDDETGQDE